MVHPRFPFRSLRHSLCVSSSTFPPARLFRHCAFLRGFCFLSIVTLALDAHSRARRLPVFFLLPPSHWPQTAFTSPNLACCSERKLSLRFNGHMRSHSSNIHRPLRFCPPHEEVSSGILKLRSQRCVGVPLNARGSIFYDTPRHDLPAWPRLMVRSVTCFPGSVRPLAA